MVKRDDASSRSGGRDSSGFRRSLPRVSFLTTFATQHRPQELADKASPSHHHHDHHHQQNQHRHRHHGHRSHNEAAKEADLRIEIKVRDLDAHRQDFTFGVRPGAFISKIDSVLRDRMSKNPIPEEALVLFYREGREIRPGSVVREAGTIFYRVLSGSDDGSLRIRWHGHDKRGDNLDSEFTKGLVRDIEQGMTLRDVRRKLAEKLEVEDASRVAVTAWGGIRPGALEGDSWEVRQVRLWLCRCLEVEAKPRDRYLVVRGLRREYLYHPSSSSSSHAVVRFVKTWIHNRLLTGVHRHGSTKVDISRRDIVLEHDGNTMEGFAEIPWGSTVQFSLRNFDAAEAFSDEESFLLPATETCAVCCDDRRISEFPTRITPKCAHKPELCKPCLQQWIESSLEGVAWDRLKCPDCPELLGYEDVKRFAAGHVFERYDDLATRSALKDIRNFRWCLDARCTSGQIHDGACPTFKCRACRARHCVAHGVPWHSGETCDEYDRRNRRRRRDERRSERAVREISKRCPACERDVHKYSGCNHITCVCGHEWCYVCFAPYRTVMPQGFLRCQHNAGCTERDIFADLEDMPGFMPPPPPAPPPLNVPGNRHHQRPMHPRWGGHWGAGMPPPPPPRRMAQAGGPPGRPGFVADDNPFRPLTPPPPRAPPAPPGFGGPGPHRRPPRVEIIDILDDDDDDDLLDGGDDLDDVVDETSDVIDDSDDSGEEREEEEDDSSALDDDSSSGSGSGGDDSDGEPLNRSSRDGRGGGGDAASDSDLDMIPPAAPAPPRFAGTPPRVREEMHRRRQQQHEQALRDFAAEMAAEMLAARERDRDRDRERTFLRERMRRRAW